ncbi:MAG: hypothetical protein V3R76_07895 [Gammaproteobacteria bacterium]
MGSSISAGLPMYLFLTGVGLLSAIIGLFWMMDRLESPLLARIAYSGLVARLAVLGAVFSVLGLLMMLVEFARRWSA